MEHYKFYSEDKRRLVINLLIDRAITPTQQRVEIGLALLTKPQHLSADQVLTRVNFDSNLVSKATVYNTLGLFVRRKLINEVSIDSAKIFYDSNTAPHHHFYNVDTGILHDIDTTAIELSHLPTPPHAAQIKDVSIIVRVQERAETA
jgi:Fur family iron response transcriptional regulator